MARTPKSSAAVPSALASVPMAAGYAMLVLSIIFNGWRYNLESAAFKVHAGAAPPISVWGVIVVGSYAAALAFFVVGWLWRRTGWTWGSLERVSPASCLQAAKAQGWLVLLAALGGSTGGWLITQSTKLYGPEFTAFLGNLMPVLLVLSGVLTGERLRRGEILAIAAALLGAFVFSYQNGHINWAGIALMVAGCMIMAAKKTLMKHATGVGHLPSVMTLSLCFTGTWGLVGAVSSGGLQFGAPASIGLTVVGGVSGAMIGMSLLYAGFNVVGLARGAPIDSLRPLAVLAIAILAGTALPGPLQLVGGGLVILGSATLAGLATRGRKSLAAAPGLDLPLGAIVPEKKTAAV